MVDETELEQPSTAPVQNQDEQAQSSSADSETENELLSVVQSAVQKMTLRKRTRNPMRLNTMRRTKLSRLYLTRTPKQMSLLRMYRSTSIPVSNS